MSEVRDYGLGGATPLNLNTSQSPMRPSRIDLEAQSPQSHVQPQERDNKDPISPIVSYVLQAIPSEFSLDLDLQDV